MTRWDNGIPIKKCKHGWTYRLMSRNLRVGVFDKKTNTFVGIRRKFESAFLDLEWHREAEGTAAPLDEIEKCPVKNLNPRFDVKLCSGCDAPVKWEKDKSKKQPHGDYLHLKPFIPCKAGDPIDLSHYGPYSKENEALFDYLKNVETRTPSYDFKSQA